ncbi:MAG: helix-turn-helix domain-containing protein, partial [Rhodospirillales bacterium]
MPDGIQLSHIFAPDQNSALGKSIVVLSAILNANKPPSLGDIALVTGIPRPTVFRIVKQLEDT